MCSFTSGRVAAVIINGVRVLGDDMGSDLTKCSSRKAGTALSSFAIVLLLLLLFLFGFCFFVCLCVGVRACVRACVRVCVCVCVCDSLFLFFFSVIICNSVYIFTFNCYV